MLHKSELNHVLGFLLICFCIHNNLLCTPYAISLICALKYLLYICICTFRWWQ